MKNYASVTFLLAWITVIPAVLVDPTAMATTVITATVLPIGYFAAFQVFYGTWTFDLGAPPGTTRFLEVVSAVALVLSLTIFGLVVVLSQAALPRY